LLQQSSLNSNLLRGNYYPFVKNLNNWSLIVYSIKDDERVTAISPTLQGTALVKGAGKNKSVQIKGINVEDADSIYDISNRLIDGNSTVEGNNILIGKGLSTDLGITSGQFVSILLPSGEVVQLLVSGIFDLENETINSSLVFMDLKRAQKLFKSGNGISTIEVQIKDPFQADVVSNEWKNQMTGVKIDQWKEQNQQLLSALSSQSSSTYTIQIFVIVAVTFGLSSVLAVSVVQKSKEIGILKAMGTTSRSASRIFILQGLMLGFIGSMVGVLFGILLIKVFVFFTQGSISFTIVYEWQSIFVIAAISIVAGVLASFIPARRSANLNPMEAIKNG
jgi:lipoprotein-releasing system permease protein